MAKVNPNQPLMPSVLDRLIDLDPGSTREAHKGQTQVLRELKQALRRDLENLLNTRWRCMSWPPDMEELDFSLVNYGLPDFTGANMAISANREEFRRIIEKVIAKFEPRLRNVRVVLMDNDSVDRVLRLRIEATLQADPVPEPVQFESSIEPASGAFEVKGEQR